MHVYNLQDLAQALNGQAVGDIALPVTGACEPQDAAGSLLAIATTQSYVERLPLGQARIALLAEGTDWHSLNLLGAVLVPRPRFAMAGLSQALDSRWRSGPSRIHPQACVEPGALIGAGARIGAFCHIGAGVVLGENAWLDSHVTLADGCVIGSEATLMAGVRIGADVRIGARFIAQPGAVIGADGFSFVTPERSAIENVRETLGDSQGAKPQSFARIHSLGSVMIGDDVELGANSCIDRGTIRDTQIGDGCKFDNLAQIGHNVKIGENCMICAQVGIAGSSVLGNNVVLGGQTGVSDNLFIGDNAITGGATKVLSNIPAGRVMLGYPAMKMEAQLEVYKNLRRLPRVLKDLSRLKKSLSDPDNSP
jgi:UDP-3-O-[3-hydroxymyristoyl] glucosamine N-acyltransferase